MKNLSRLHLYYSSLGILREENAFSLAEMLIVISILGILSSVAIASGIESIRRERSNSIIVGLAGWLETVRSSASRGNNCTITINQGAFSTAGVLASVTSGSSSCLGRQFIAPDISTASYSLTSSTQSFTFTRRGSLSAPSSSSVTIAINSASGPARCLLVEGLAGSIYIGKPSGSTCSIKERF